MHRFRSQCPPLSHPGPRQGCPVPAGVQCLGHQDGCRHTQSSGLLRGEVATVPVPGRQPVPVFPNFPAGNSISNALPPDPPLKSRYFWMRVRLVPGAAFTRGQGRLGHSFLLAFSHQTCQNTCSEPGLCWGLGMEEAEVPAPLALTTGPTVLSPQKGVEQR